MITFEQLKEMTGIDDPQVLDGINITLEKYKINTPLRMRHFFAQVLHESNNLHTLKENLNYSAKGLRTTFKKYFPSDEIAVQYARQPEKIANRVYASRMGNGNEASGDGWRFRGRGALQITGKDNYTKLSKDTGIDFVAKPELLETPQYGTLSAGWYWNKNGINALADKDNIKAVTKSINGGYIGLDSRIAIYNRLKTIIV